MIYFSCYIIHSIIFIVIITPYDIFIISIKLQYYYCYIFFSSFSSQTFMLHKRTNGKLLNPPVSHRLQM